MAPADEPRRSGRATKGQHRKDSEEPETVPAPTPPPTKKVTAAKKGKKGSKKQQEVEEEEEEPEAIIRCICGYVEEDPDDKRAMICCDKCSAWQHNVCMGLPEDDDDLPEQYFCEQCRPQDHQETVVALKRREKIWEIRQAEHDRREEEERQRKKGGRKGGRKSKGGSSTDAIESKQDSSQPTDQSSSQAIPAASFYGKAETGQKRKMSDQAAPDTADDDDIVTSKTRRVSTAKDAKSTTRRQSSGVGTKGSTKHVELQTELVEKIEDLHNRVRQKAAGAFVKMFEGLSTQAIANGTLKLPKGQTKDAFALSLGLSVEFCLYIGFWGHGSEPNPPYSEKLRIILHNVKANPELRDRLFNKSLSPDELTQMSSDEMASRELQAEKAKLIAETEKQNILLPETGPKFRKTHKGDELIEESNNHNVFTDSAPQLSSRILEAATKEESPDRAGSHSPTAFQPASFKPPSKPLTVDTQGRRRSTIDRKSSSGFDMNNVWSSVDSPSAARPAATPSTPGIRGPGAKADPEIDQLLGDADDEDEPYSPAEYALEPGQIWRGNLVMPTVAEFRGSAKYAAGANLESRYPWTSLIGKTLWVEGRIPANTASEYVCNLRWSKTTDVSVISLIPEDNAADQEGFDKLFEYFITRQRWGVGKSPLEHTRDVYIIPLEAGEAPKPEFLSLLEDSNVEDKRTQKQLLVVYIIKLTQQQTGPSATPIPPPAQTVISPPNAQSNGASKDSAFPPPPGATSTQANPEESELQGRAAAELVLGQQYLNAPTASMILDQAPNCGETQFRHVKEVYVEDPRTMTDWNLLVTALTQRAEAREAAERDAAVT